MRPRPSRRSSAPFSGIIAILGGFSILLGYHARPWSLDARKK